MYSPAVRLQLSEQVVAWAPSTATTDAAAWSILTRQLGPCRHEAQLVLLHVSGQVEAWASSTARTDAAACSDRKRQFGPRRCQTQRAGQRHSERREAVPQVLNQRMAPAHDVRGR